MSTDPLAGFRRLGMRAASPTALLSVGLSRCEEDVAPNVEVAQLLLQGLGHVRHITDLSSTELRDRFGLDAFECDRALALIELGRRAALANKGVQSSIGVPEDVYAELTHLIGEKREHFVVLLLDAKNKVYRSQTVHIGTLHSTVVGPREVFRVAVREGASSIVVAHNHPSGDPEPSPEDLAITKRLVRIGEELDVPVLDHVIIGDPEFVSFRRRGLL
ncbi:MAG: DNA repair protein RadC [Fimbriimonadaceae bacterium]|nr:DNA repair protein RadC [Fimbriimonadaceae bacterium]